MIIRFCIKGSWFHRITKRFKLDGKITSLHNRYQWPIAFSVQRYCFETGKEHVPLRGKNLKICSKYCPCNVLIALFYHTMLALQIT